MALIVLRKKTITFLRQRRDKIEEKDKIYASLADPEFRSLKSKYKR